MVTLQDFQQPVGANFSDFSDVFDVVIQGSVGAEERLRRGAENAFRVRAEGIAGSRSEFENRLLGEEQARGLNPTIGRRLLFETQQEPAIAITQARGEIDSQLSQDLAELFKGTSTEIAQLGITDKSLAQQRDLQAKLRRALEKAGKRQFFGQLLNVGLGAASLALGPPGAGLGALAGGGLNLGGTGAASIGNATAFASIPPGV